MWYLKSIFAHGHAMKYIKINSLCRGFGTSFEFENDEDNNVVTVNVSDKFGYSNSDDVYKGLTELFGEFKGFMDDYYIVMPKIYKGLYGITFDSERYFGYRCGTPLTMDNYYMIGNPPEITMKPLWEFLVKHPEGYTLDEDTIQIIASKSDTTYYELTYKNVPKNFQRIVTKMRILEI
jgi:hypothetical protein